MAISSARHVEQGTWPHRPSRRLYGPREITENAPSYLFGEYIRHRIRRADTEIAALHADAGDVEVAQERLRESETEGTVPWDEIKRDLDL